MSKNNIEIVLTIEDEGRISVSEGKPEKDGMPTMVPFRRSAVSWGIIVPAGWPAEKKAHARAMVASCARATVKAYEETLGMLASVSLGNVKEDSNNGS